MTEHSNQCQKEAKLTRSQVSNQRETRQNQPDKVDQPKISYWDGQLPIKRRYWDKVELKHYINVLFRQRHYFINPSNNNKLHKAYLNMSNLIITRNRKQCVSLHHTMKRKYINVHTIVDEYSDLLQPKNYSRWL